MTERFTFVTLCLAVASVAAGQNIPPASREPALRTVARAEGRRILVAIPSVDAGSETETDCSHLVHDIYEKAGFPYDYVTSHELYTGSTNFARVRGPQPGDLVVWPGHVGIVIDPKQHSFFSFVRSGPETQFYDSSYWRSRGIARFYRYLADSSQTLEARDQRKARAIGDDRTASESRSALSAPATNRDTSEASREIVVRVAGKNPSSEEIAAAFVEMNQDSGELLRARSLNSLGRTVVVYREMLVSAVQIKGKHGTAFVRIESLGAPADAQTDSQPRWKERPLGFEKTKRGWVISRIQDIAYVKREVALQALSARLSELAKNTAPTAAQKAEQREVVRLLNWLVVDDPPSTSAQSN